MKTITFNSRRWDSETEQIVEHHLSIKVSNETANALLEDISKSPVSAFTADYIEGMDAEFAIQNEDGSYEFHAVNL